MKNTAATLRELADLELTEKEKSLKKELFELNFQRKAGRVEKPHRFFLIKKEIARIKTILRERQLRIKNGKE